MQHLVLERIIKETNETFDSSVVFVFVLTHVTSPGFCWSPAPSCSPHGPNWSDVCHQTNETSDWNIRHVSLTSTVFVVSSGAAGTNPTDSTFNFNSLWILLTWRELQLALTTNVLQRETFYSDTLSPGVDDLHCCLTHSRGILKPGDSWSQPSVHHFIWGHQDELDSSRDPGDAASPRPLLVVAASC